MRPPPERNHPHRFPARCLAVWVGLAAIACGAPDPVETARTLLEAGRPAEAIEVLRDRLGEGPGDAELHYVYGAALLANRSASLAVWPLRRAARDPKLAVEAGLLLVRALLNGGAADDAVWAADAVLDLEPENVQVLALRAQANLRSLDEEAALEDIARLIQLGYGDGAKGISLLQTKLEAELKLARVEEATATIAELRARATDTEGLSVAAAARLRAASRCHRRPESCRPRSG